MNVKVWAPGGAGWQIAVLCGGLSVVGCTIGPSLVVEDPVIVTVTLDGGGGGVIGPEGALEFDNHGSFQARYPRGSVFEFRATPDLCKEPEWLGCADISGRRTSLDCRVRMDGDQHLRLTFRDTPNCGAPLTPLTVKVVGNGSVQVGEPGGATKAACPAHSTCVFTDFEGGMAELRATPGLGGQLERWPCNINQPACVVQLATTETATVVFGDQPSVQISLTQTDRACGQASYVATTRFGESTETLQVPGTHSIQAIGLERVEVTACPCPRDRVSEVVVDVATTATTTEDGAICRRAVIDIDATTTATTSRVNIDFIRRVQLAMGTEALCVTGVQEIEDPNQVRVLCIGDNEYGELALGHTMPERDLSGVMPNFATGSDGLRIRELSMSPGLCTATSRCPTHACGLTEDHRVICWGDNSQGQCGRSGPDSFGADPGDEVAFESPVDLPGVLQVEAGNDFSCALVEDGDVYCWGSDQYGKLGRAPTSTVAAPEPDPQLVEFPDHPRIARISLGVDFGTAEAESGELFAWGRYGNFGGMGQDEVGPPQRIFGDRLGRQLTAGSKSACAVSIDDGRVYCVGPASPWGGNGSRRADDPYLLEHQTFAQNPVELHADAVRTCALYPMGKAQCWGRLVPNPPPNGSVLPPFPYPFEHPSDEIVETAIERRASSVSNFGGSAMCFLTRTAKLFCFGADERPIDLDGDRYDFTNFGYAIDVP